MSDIKITMDNPHEPKALRKLVGGAVFYFADKPTAFYMGCVEASDVSIDIEDACTPIINLKNGKVTGADPLAMVVECDVEIKIIPCANRKIEL